MFSYLRYAVHLLYLRLSGQNVQWAGSSDKSEIVRIGMEVLVSVFVLSASFFGLLSPDVEADSKKFLGAFIGLVLGYWLRPKG